MKFTPAIEACAELGWLFTIEDTTRNEKPASIVYAKRGNEKYRLAGCSEFVKMSKAQFAYRLARLPAEEEQEAHR